MKGASFMVRPIIGACPRCGGPWGPPWWIGGPWVRPPWGGPCVGPRCRGPWIGASADIQSASVPAMRYMGGSPPWMGQMMPYGWQRFGYDMDFDD